ncbi:RNA-directed DNA polymerase, eukaryota, reverse transcriptase zinc-binding domain protein [Tanacetum coccineum]
MLLGMEREVRDCQHGLYTTGGVSRVDEMILARERSGFAGKKVWDDIPVVTGFVGRERRLLGGMSWSWKHLLTLRDKIKDFVNIKIGNGKPCSVWFDKWNSGGPLSKLIDHRIIYIAGLDINAKVIDLIKNNAWCWPIDWGNEYDSVLDVPVPSDLEDKPVWINKKRKEKCLMLLRHAFITWVAIKERLKTRDRLARWFNISDMSCLLCNMDNESHSHLFFSCNYSKRLWERLKPMALLDGISNDWAMVISGLVNKPANNSIWSVVQRLVFGSAIYFIWQERNIRRMEQRERSIDGLFKVIFDTVRIFNNDDHGIIRIKDQSKSVIHESVVWQCDYMVYNWMACTGQSLSEVLWYLVHEFMLSFVIQLKRVRGSGVMMMNMLMYGWLDLKFKSFNGYLIVIGGVLLVYCLLKIVVSLGDSDWPQDFLMIQSMLVSFS